jgi:phospholipase C
MSDSPIEHVVVLMMENHSFDHMLGGYAGPLYEKMPSQLAKLPSVFHLLKEHNLSWQIYHEDHTFATELVLETVQAQPSATQADPGFRQFYADVGSGNLANYVFLTPTLANAQHDGKGVGPLPGDKLMGEIFRAIFSSPLWERTLLVITYDEHGGHYDHVPPPLSYRNDAGQCVTIPNPDSSLWNSATWGSHFSPPEFDFTCLGVRVPALLVSAYTPPGVDATLYEHASIPATLNELWGLGTLTKRDAGANSFLKNVHPFAKRSQESLLRSLPPRVEKP